MKTMNSDGLGTAIAAHMSTVFDEVTRSEKVNANDRWWRVITHDPHPFANFAIVHDHGDAQAVTQALEPLSQLDLPAGVVFPTVDDDEAAEAAAALGFTLIEKMPAMAMSLEGWTCPSCPEGYTMRAVDMTHEAATWHQAMAEGYGVPLQVASMFGLSGLETGSDAVEARYFGVFKDDRMMATSVACMDGELGGVYCVATLAEARKQGLGEAITGLAAQAIQDAGYPMAILQASEMGTSMYTSMGFQTFGGIPLYGRNLG